MATETKLTPAKAIAAAIGTTLTALTTALATVQLVLADDAVDLAEVSTLAAAVVAAGATIYAVWRTPNKVVATRARAHVEQADWRGDQGF